MFVTCGQVIPNAWNNYVFLLFLLITLFRYKFDDERVTKEDVKRALEEQYGGEEEVNSF